MIRKQTLIIIATASALVAGSALASDIYRYTDAEGNIHYVDRPTGEASEQRVAIASKRSSTSQAQARNSEPQNSGAQESAAAVAEEAAAQKQTRAEKNAEKKERDKKCASYRAKLESMVTSRRLYREDENGEREYLDDAQIEEARSKAQQLVEENCS